MFSFNLRGAGLSDRAPRPLAVRRRPGRGPGRGSGLGTAGEDDHDRARQALQDGKILPLRDVLDRVERDYPGQVVKVEFEEDDGEFIYEIRLLQSGGGLIKMKIDARDGKVLGVKGRDIQFRGKH